MTVVLVAKVPLAGRSKTRLGKTIGAELAADMAKCMLLDLLQAIPEAVAGRKRRLVMLYAPEDKSAEAEQLVAAAGTSECWELQPLPSAVAAAGLKQVLQFGLEVCKGSEVVFLGMDSLEVAAGSRILDALESVGSRADTAVLAKAADGGYVMLGLPKDCPKEVFEGVEWSSERTCDTQKQKLESQGFQVCMHDEILGDVDVVEDLPRLKEFLESKEADKLFSNTKDFLKAHKL